MRTSSWTVHAGLIGYVDRVAMSPTSTSTPTRAPMPDPAAPSSDQVLLRDPVLPVVDELLAPGVPEVLEAAVAAVGSRVVHATMAEVTWWPGASVTVRWHAEVVDGPLAGRHDLVATTKSAPAGAHVVGVDSDRVTVWRVPHDPHLPGLAPALDPDVATAVVRSLGGSVSRARTRLRSYRPTRRGVVEVTGEGQHLYLKVVGPGQARYLHRRHVELEEHLPVPASLGFDPERGIVALAHLSAPTLRRVLEDPNVPLPPPEEVVGLATSFPRVHDPRAVPSPIDRLPGLVGVLGAVLPGEAERLAGLMEAVGDDTVSARRPAHGDLHEAQLLVADGRVTGIVDVDGVGMARPADDLATLLGHLAVWTRLSRQPERCRGFAGSVLRHADGVVDPVDLRRRVAAVVAGLATGPFRVQAAHWPAETAARIDLAVRWVESARRVDGRTR